MFCGPCFLAEEFKRNLFMWLFKQRASRNSQQPLRFHQRAFLLERIHLRGKSYLWMSLFNKRSGIHLPRTNSTIYAIKYSYSYFILNFSNQIQHQLKKKRKKETWVLSWQPSKWTGSFKGLICMYSVKSEHLMWH